MDRIEENENKIIAVYDLGGGTFDVSILRLEMEFLMCSLQMEITELGGDDFDQAIIQYWEKNQQLIIPTEYKEKNTLRQFAEKAKFSQMKMVIFLEHTIIKILN